MPGSGASLEKRSCDKRLEASRLIKEGAVPAQRRENESVHSGGAGQWEKQSIPEVMTDGTWQSGGV